MLLHTAVRAGVVVALAGGNSGPRPSTVSNNAPGAITVAASTLPRSFPAVLRLGDGTVLEGTGALTFKPTGPLPLVYSGNATAVGALVNASQLCAPGSLDPAKVAGKAVVSAKQQCYPRLCLKHRGWQAQQLATCTSSWLNATQECCPRCNPI